MHCLAYLGVLTKLAPVEVVSNVSLCAGNHPVTATIVHEKVPGSGIAPEIQPPSQALRTVNSEAPERMPKMVARPEARDTPKVVQLCSLEKKCLQGHPSSLEGLS